MPTFFIFLKYTFVIVLFIIGSLILLRLRGIYLHQRIKDPGNSNKVMNNVMNNVRLVLGCTYIILAFGILFNYLTYFLIWILEPLPDRLIYSFIDLIDVDPYAINRITDINSAIYPHEKTIYYVFSMFSFGHTVHLILSIWYLQFEVKNPRKTIINLFGAVSGCILFGFTTFMPFML